MYDKWLPEHVAKVSDALSERLKRDAMGGLFRRQQMIYCPSVPGTRGGIAVVPDDDDIPSGWLPVIGVMSDAYAMTRAQIHAKLETATATLPVLDPNES